MPMDRGDGPSPFVSSGIAVAWGGAVRPNRRVVAAFPPALGRSLAPPFFEERDIRLLRVLTDRGTEFCGIADVHPYELYLAIDDITHTKTKVRRPQTNGICERFHKTVLDEFYRITFRKKLYSSIEGLQADLDAWLRDFNEQRPHQGRWCFGKTPLKNFLDSLTLAKEKMVGSAA
jgi:transposase InsO family protein